MDRVNQAIQGTNDLERMTSDVLEAVLSIFACDRAWLVHPCDPLAPTWRVVMEHTRAEFPGAFALGIALPVTPEVAAVFEAAKRSGGAVRFDPESDHRLPTQLAERFTIRSMIVVVVSPKMGEPYLFGLHQCSSPRVWAPTEERLFREIGRRLADALTSVLIFRSLRESERRLDEAQRVAQVGYWDRDLAAGRMTLSVEGGRIFGLQPEERVVDLAVWQERWQAFIHPEDRPRALHAVAAALAGGPRYDVEFRIIRRNGEVRVVHSQGDVITDASGRPCRMFGTMQDITERKRAEAELRVSEERFRTLVQFSFDVYWETDAQHRFTRQEFAEGLADAPAPGSEIGKTRWEVPYLEPDEEAWRQHRATLDAHLPFRDFELARPMPDGGKRYVSVSGLPAFDATGRFIGYRGVGRHITDRKRAEQALRQSEAYLAEAQRLSHTGSWALDVASDTYVYVSEEGFRIFGFDTQEGLPTRKAVSRRINPEDWDRVKAAFATSLLERVATSIEFRIALPGGTVKHVQVIQHPVLNDAGDVVELVGTVIDVTERKLAEQRLLAQHTVAQILAEAATVEEATPKILQAVCDCLAWDVGVLWRPDRGAGVLRCAEIWHTAALTIPQFLAINRATAFRPGEALPGQVWASRAPAAIPDVVQDASMRRGPAAGRENLHGALAFPILLAGEVLGVLEFFSRELLHPNQDLLRMMGTIGSQIGQFIERKRAERALYEAQANLTHVTRVTTLGELAASIAHEVNQPLAAMVADAKASLNWLAKVNPDLDLVREVLANIMADGHRAAEVIQRIRQLAKKSAGLEKVRLDVNELIRDVLPLVRGEVLRHRISLRLELTSPLPPVLADRVQLHQVLINLVMNGIEAMASVHDRPRELVLRSQALDGEDVHVMVEDVGIGIDPKTADRMFTAFFSTKPGGMGMGLSITRSIIEAHGGRIWATANAQHGTTFHVVLPRMR
jgi:PAS domain S-box-containing protein